jgi:hypothetical protein
VMVCTMVAKPTRSRKIRLLISSMGLAHHP